MALFRSLCAAFLFLTPHFFAYTLHSILHFLVGRLHPLPARTNQPVPWWGVSIIMAATETAFQKIEQAKALIEEARLLVEEKNQGETQVQELNKVSNVV